MTAPEQTPARVLFVDDEANILTSLRRLLRRMRGEWEMTFVGSGAEALEELSRQPFDAIVSDMRMPQMDGATLLEEARKQHPGMARIILSGYATQESLLRAVGPAHNFLSKPCDKETLVANVQRSLRVRRELDAAELRKLVLQVDSLPSLPEAYSRLVGELNEDESSIEAVGKIVAGDIAMSAKLLQFVNSSYFDLPNTLADPVEAVRVLGMSTVKALVLGSELFSASSVDELTALHRHAEAVVYVARSLARELVDVPEDQACLAAMVHQVGSIILAAADPEAFRSARVRMREEPWAEVERELFGATHVEVGAHLLDLWGLPDPVVEAVMFHHRPQTAPTQSLSPMTVLHLADALVTQSKGEGCDTFDMEYLDRLELTASLPAWSERFAPALEPDIL